jgi:hypothetical protein
MANLTYDEPGEPMLERETLERPYKGYVVEGQAEPVGPHSDLWVPIGKVLLSRPDGSVLQIERFRNEILADEDGAVAAWFGLGIAEISVDRCLPPPAYYLIPMNVARAVDILRRGAEDHHKREIRMPELYEALTFLDQLLGKRNWLVRRYRNSLRGDTRNHREKLDQREKLRVCFRGIQHACVEILLAEINDLARRYRENRPRIDVLRRQLAVVQRPVGK